MQVKFKVGNSGVFLGRGQTRNGVNWVDGRGERQPVERIWATGASAIVSRGLDFRLSASRVEVSDVNRSYPCRYASSRWGAWLGSLSMAIVSTFAFRWLSGFRLPVLPFSR